MRSSPIPRALLLGGAAVAVGFACGATTRTPAESGLAAAGSPRDDGSGLLARASVALAVLLDRGDDAAPGGATYGYGQDPDAELHAHAGGASYGGTRYAGYAPDLADVMQLYRPAPAPYERGYTAISVTDGGAIEGRVIWRRPPAAPATLPATGACAGQVANESLVADERGQIANAVVFLEDIRRGRQGVDRINGVRMQLGGALEQRGCRFRPHVQILAPIGAALRLVNGDDQPRHYAGRLWTATGHEPLFLVPLRHRGESRELLLERPGFIEVRGTGAGDPGGAWVVVAAHPYYALTDEHGGFRLDQVPPGTYTLATWHEPVVTGVDAAGRPITTEPVVRRTEVTVRQGHESRVTVDLGAP